MTADDIEIKAVKYELVVSHNDLLGLRRAAEIALGNDDVPLDDYEKELLVDFIEETATAITSPGTFVKIEDDNEQQE